MDFFKIFSVLLVFFCLFFKFVNSCKGFVEIGLFVFARFINFFI